MTTVAIDGRRLVDLSLKLVSTPSFTARGGVRERLGRGAWLARPAGAVAAGRGRAGERAGHVAGRRWRADTDVQRASRYVLLGREPWLAGIPGFRPEGFERDGRVYGLGISNMKGAVACYVEAVRALQESGVRLRGDVLVAGVCGEDRKGAAG